MKGERMNYPMLLRPAVSELVWGGTRLIEEYGIKTDKKNAAEAWVLSCHPKGESVILNGSFAGRPLREAVEANPAVCGEKGKAYKQFPLLIKFIDAKDDLSVQVHPDEAYAAKSGGAGKTEAWYILDCDEGAELVLGFKSEIGEEEFREAVQTGTLMDKVQRVKVKKGDLFYIEAGTLHAICKGILLAEVQQSSDTTYRIFDYNRPGLDGKPRELHIGHALAVTRREPFDFKANRRHDEGGERSLLLSSAFFSIVSLEVSGAMNGEADDTSFVSLLALEGKGKLLYNDIVLDIQKGTGIFIPAALGEYRLEGKIKLLETRL